MAFELLKTELHYMLRTVTSLSRAIRAHMRQAIEKDEQFRNALYAALKEESTKGNVRGVQGAFKSARETLEKSEDLVLDSEERLVAVESTFEDKLRGLPAGLDEVLVHVNRMKDSRRAIKLKEIIHSCQAEINQMYDTMSREIQNEYMPIQEQASGQATHRFIDRARGLAILARAMNDAYQLRKEWVEIKKILEEIEKTEHVLDQAMDKINKDVEDRLDKAIHEGEENLGRLIMELVQTVTATFERFTHIVRVMVAYFFVIAQDQDLLSSFVDELEREEFPRDNLNEMVSTLRNGKTKLHERAIRIAHSVVRLRHVR